MKIAGLDQCVTILSFEVLLHNSPSLPPVGSLGITDWFGMEKTLKAIQFGMEKTLKDIHGQGTMGRDNGQRQPKVSC